MTKPFDPAPPAAAIAAARQARVDLDAAFACYNGGTNWQARDRLRPAYKAAVAEIEQQLRDAGFTVTVRWDGARLRHGKAAATATSGFAAALGNWLARCP